MNSNLTKQLLKSILPKYTNSFITNKNQLIKPWKLIKNTGPSSLIMQITSPKFTLISSKQFFNFSQQKKGPLNPEDIPQQNLQVAITEDKVQNEDVQVIHTKGTLSILDKVPGPKNPQTGQLYVLMFTCGQCNAKQIKSFTKNAYHKGVVLARCVGCDKVHLVADNLGWFEDEPTNVQTLHQGKVKKVHDHGAINAFLQKAFSQEQQLLTSQNQGKEQRRQQKPISEEKK